jgi:hypothetical protein
MYLSDDMKDLLISKADLIHAKREANRPKDRIDLEELES